MVNSKKKIWHKPKFYCLNISTKTFGGGTVLDANDASSYTS
jgi:hypothetical protein